MAERKAPVTRGQPAAASAAPETGVAEVEPKVRRAGRRQRGALTIREVASLAGVSPMTVSRVINDDRRVRAETRAAVHAAIKALNFSPNPAARSLASADAVRFGLLFDNPSKSFLSEFLMGALDQSAKSGIQLLIHQCDETSDIQAIVDRFMASGVDGIVLTCPLGDSEDVLDILRRAKAPAAVVAGGFDATGVSAVGIDEWAAAHAMTMRLIELGHRRIGFVVGDPSISASSLRRQGYVDAIREAGLPLDDDLIRQGHFSYKSGLEAAEALLALKSPPTAIFASNDDMAAGASSVAHRLGLDVPRDITICGFDDTPLASSVWPALTTVRQPIAEMSRRAIELLLDDVRARRGGRDPQHTHATLDFTIVPRESDGPPPRG